MAVNEQGHKGKYSGNSRHSYNHAHTKVTSENYEATKHDDEKHMEYLKEDVKYDDHHGHSDINMTADEKHISKLAGDLKYDEKHHGAGKHIDPNVDHPNYGDIKEAPSKLTQAYRSFKNDKTGPYNMARNLASTAFALAPIPSIGKVKAIGNIGKTIASKAKEIKMFGPRLAFQSAESAARDLAKPLSPAMIKKLQSMQPKSTSQNLQEAFSYPREILNPKLPMSKPVNFKGPNPANNIGAGGNSYPK